MKLTKCASGHFYDADKYPECPYCNTGLQTDSSIVRSGAAEDMLGIALCMDGEQYSPKKIE